MHENLRLVICSENLLRIEATKTILDRKAAGQARFAAAGVTLLWAIAAWANYLIWTSGWLIPFAVAFFAVLGLVWLFIALYCLEYQIPGPLRILITYTVIVYASWVSAEVTCLRPARHFRESTEYVDSLRKRVTALEGAILPLQKSEALRHILAELHASLGQELAGVMTGVSYQSPEADKWLRTDGICNSSAPVTWGALLACEGIIETVELLLDGDTLAGWIADECPDLQLFRFTGQQWVRREPSEVYGDPELWPNFESDYVTSGILQKEREIVSSLRTLEGSIHLLRRLHRRSNRVFRSRHRRMGLAQRFAR